LEEWTIYLFTKLFKGRERARICGIVSLIVNYKIEINKKLFILIITTWKNFY